MLRTSLLVLLCVSMTSGAAAEDVVLQGNAGAIRGKAWAITGLQSVFGLTGTRLDGDIRVARITLTDSGRSFDDVSVACRGIVVTTRGVSCDDARFTAPLPALGRQTVAGAFAWDKLDSTVRIVLRDLVVAKGRMQVEVLAGPDGIEAGYSGKSLQLDGLLQMAGEFGDALSTFSGGGEADIDGRLSMPGDGPLHVIVAADLDSASLANDAGTVAAADVTGRLEIDVSQEPGRTRFDLVFDSSQGEAYVEPVYGNFREHAFRLRADNVRTSDFTAFDIGRFELRQASLLDAAGTARLEFPVDADAPVGITLDVALRDSSVANLYTSLVRVLLAGTVLGNLDTDGRVSGTVSIADNTLQSAALQLDDVIVDDRLGRFAVYGIDGVIDWQAEAVTASASRLSWDSGTVYNLTVGGGELRLNLAGNDIELLAPLRLPTMGGALRINELALHDFGGDAATGRLDAELEPVQLGQLSGALGWPAFSGTLSGRLPLLQLAENTVTVGGDLSAQLFDGTMTMSNLRVEQPFGRVPRLTADLSLRGLDLQRVTEAFSFGYIQGRLSGDVTGLQLQNWRPVAMDLHLYTPPNDRSQHRISQRAVENLASVGGGGAAAALSSGFLQFFEVFAYDRIGLRCRLRDGVCAMSGVEPARAGPQGTGFYIVKGRGVPRIDVVGYRDTVSWARLVQQLAAITRSGSPTVN